MKKCRDTVILIFQTSSFRTERTRRSGFGTTMDQRWSSLSRVRHLQVQIQFQLSITWLEICEFDRKFVNLLETLQIRKILQNLPMVILGALRAREKILLFQQQKIPRIVRRASLPILSCNEIYSCIFKTLIHSLLLRYTRIYYNILCASIFHKFKYFLKFCVG